jgi:hypothetical protein
MRWGMWTLLAAGLLCAGPSATRANDPVRFGGSSAQTAIQGSTANQPVYHRSYGGYRRGYYRGTGDYYRPYSGSGFYRSYSGYGYRQPYYGGYYRPYSGTYFRPYYGGGFYRSYQGGFAPSQGGYYRIPD